MPKHYCDYCDVFLTHDSASVRKAHNNGRNHLANVRDYYASLGHDKAQSIIDQITAAYESGSGPPPGGFGFRPSDLVDNPAPSFGPPPGMFGGPPPPGGFPPRPPFPPGPGGLPMMPPGGPPPFPPNFPGGPPPFPPSGPPGGAMPPFPPNAQGGPPPAQSPPNDGPSSGPSIHPDRLRMMGVGGGPPPQGM